MLSSRSYGYEFRSPKEIKKQARRVQKDIRKKRKKIKIYTTSNTAEIYKSWKPVMRQNGKSMNDIMVALGLRKRHITITVKENKDNG